MSETQAAHGVAAILVAAGSGERLGAGSPKALVRVGGLPLVRHAAERIRESRVASSLVVVAPNGDDLSATESALSGLELPHSVVPGGRRRRDSVAIGVAGAYGASVLVVHDAARPLTSGEVFRRVVTAARESGAAVSAVPVSDTIVRSSGLVADELVARDGLFRVQTPQAFRYELLERAHAEVDHEWDAPDDGSMVARLGEEVRVVEGEESNIKVTRPEDLSLVESRLAGKAAGGAEGESRVGIGWDVHPLVAGRPFRLVGVEIDTESGPAGHSDGDPLGHAVADALLGAAGLGDIGSIFPDDDPRFAGIAGDMLLTEVVSRLGSAGWVPAQVDAVIVVDRPKISPHRNAIRARLSGILGVPLDAASVKGKRTEGLSGISNARGVVCHAIVKIVRVPCR